MTDSNLPEPPPEPAPEPTPELPKPTPEATPELPEAAPEVPEAASPPTPPPQSSAHTLLYGCLSIVFALPFGIVYILLTAAFGLGGGAACAAAIVLGMFLFRRDKPASWPPSSRKRPIIGALAVGAAIAFVLYGTCLIIIAKST